MKQTFTDENGIEQPNALPSEEFEPWEVRLDKEFGEVNPDIKHFIRTEIEAARYEGYELGLKIAKAVSL